MSPPKAKFSDDVCVSREEILKHFSPAPSYPTFFRWVNEGKIKKARDLQGYYLLNATLVHQGMPAVDTSAYLKRIKETPTALKNRQLMYLAAVNLDHQHQILCTPPDFKLPDEFSTDELDKISKIQEELLGYTKHFDQPSEWQCWLLGVLASLATLEILERDGV